MFISYFWHTHTTIVVIQSTPVPRDKCKTMKLPQRKPEQEHSWNVCEIMTLVRFNGSTYRNPPKRQRTIRAVALRREVCSGLVEKIVVKLLRWPGPMQRPSLGDKNLCGGKWNESRPIFWNLLLTLSVRFTERTQRWNFCRLSWLFVL